MRHKQTPTHLSFWNAPMVTSEAIESHRNPQLTFERILSFATRFYRGLRPSRMTSGRRCSFVDMTLQNPKETPHPSLRATFSHWRRLIKNLIFAKFRWRTSERNAPVILERTDGNIGSDRISSQIQTNLKKNLIFCYEILSGTPILESVRPLQNDKRWAFFRALRMTVTEIPPNCHSERRTQSVVEESLCNS